MGDIDCFSNSYDPYPPMKSKAKRTMCYSFKKENCLSIIEDGERSSYSIPDEVCNYPGSVPECADYLSLAPLRYSQTHDAYIFDLFASVKTWQVNFVFYFFYLPHLYGPQQMLPPHAFVSPRPHIPRHKHQRMRALFSVPLPTNKHGGVALNEVVIFPTVAPTWPDLLQKLGGWRTRCVVSNFTQVDMDWDNSRCALDNLKDEMRILRHVSECRDPSMSSSSSSDMFHTIHRGQKSERPLNRAILSFFGTYGSHFMTKAIYGAKCSQTFVLPKDLQIGAYRTFFEHVTENQPSFVRWTGRGEDEEKRDSRFGEFMALDLSSIPYKIVDIDCEGSIYASEKRQKTCPFIPGDHLAPTVLSAEWRPIWEMHILMARLVYSEKCASLLANKMNKVYMALEESKKNCGEEICDGNGICSFGEIIWTDDWIYEGILSIPFFSFLY